ncbi:MAG: DUF6263 family protein [Bacteroidales bacterium]|jgi:hypothetical protein|nr:hypothetical protein [Bacteroidales bacterium]HNQ59285.1 DUF6263 family protein [Bacteroidales bacterium]HPY09280.1 DUF6263 family protein [Bacteroidales bacterium]HQB24585.1 DUF6263 family protein [Bacteroidales bacterium]HQN86630.1 DUF6263 family protein [Bacteroidales bacterium]
MKKFLFFVFSILFGLQAVAQQDVSLKLNLEKNRTYRLRSVSHQIVTQTVSGNQQTVESDVLYTFSLKMLDATPEFIITEIHFDTIISKTNAMGKIENISSTRECNIKSQETGEIMSCVMNKLSRNAIFAKLDYSGQPIEILNASLISGMILQDTTSITLTGPVASALKSQIVQTVSENSLKTMIKGFTYYLAGNKVNIGDKWKIFDQVNSGGMLLTITSECQLKEVKDNNASITMESNIKPFENAPPIQSGGATVSYNTLNGITKSNMIIDINTGLVVENKSKTRISGNLSINAPGFSMEIPMNINGETLVEAVN